jgi:hypothetical protein
VVHAPTYIQRRTQAARQHPSWAGENVVQPYLAATYARAPRAPA